ncbi:MAG: DUF6328 family protein [Streptosporangiaceae bacterium]
MGPSGEARPGSGVPPDPREESGAQRADRNLGELLQELLVAGLGVQVLFGFLLSLPFTTRFHKLDGLQRGLYLAAILLAVGSIIALVAPVAFHRVLFRQRRKGWLVMWANRSAILGLVLVAAAVSVAVDLVVSFVTPGAVAIAIACAVPPAFGGLWFAMPLSARLREGPEE